MRPLPQFYSDQFNTTTVGGQQVVGVLGSLSAPPVTPLMVPSNPRDSGVRPDAASRSR